MEGRRCLIVANGRQGPIVAPLAFWFDGTSAWMAPPASHPAIAAVERDPKCALWAGGTIARGFGRVFSLRDPFGLTLHSPMVAAAMAALATTSASTIVGYLQGAARAPSRLLPGNRVALRVTVTSTENGGEPALPPGIAPALPTVIPPDVRRALAGQRRILLATAEDVVRASWGGGFGLSGLADSPLVPGAEAAAALEADELGLCLAGVVTPGPALRPERATWWHGFALGQADIPAPTATPGGITLPD